MNIVSHSQFAVMLHSVPHLGPKGISRLMKDAVSGLSATGIDLGKVQAWQVSADTLQKEYSLHPEAAKCISYSKDSLLDAGSEISSAADKLNIRIITILDPDYPASLKDYETYPPPILYAHGNMALLHERRYSVVSSSNISAQGIEVTREISSILADEGLTAVTSHNTYPYQISGLAARSRNAPVILVLDRGILSAFPQGLGWEPVAQARIWNIRFDPQKDLVLSKFRLYDPWIGANGKERDRMVFALSDTVVAIEIRVGGVMESECMRALKYGREVYVFKPDNSVPGGNEKLITQGCQSLPSSWTRSYLSTIDIHQTDDHLDDIEY